jgi:hypothetical protein
LTQSVVRISWISISAHVESAKNTTRQTITIMREEMTCPIAESINNISVQNLQGGLRLDKPTPIELTGKIRSVNTIHCENK